MKASLDYIEKHNPTPDELYAWWLLEKPKTEIAGSKSRTPRAWFREVWPIVRLQVVESGYRVKLKLKSKSPNLLTE